MEKNVSFHDRSRTTFFFFGGTLCVFVWIGLAPTPHLVRTETQGTQLCSRFHSLDCCLKLEEKQHSVCLYDAFPASTRKLRLKMNWEKNQTEVQIYSRIQGNNVPQDLQAIRLIRYHIIQQYSWYLERRSELDQVYTNV